MELLAAAILGTIQGLTEFLPVSSSAHLILVPWILGWRPEGITFDVSLHLGTAAAILAYFWREWIELAREVVQGLLERKPMGNAQRRLAWYLILGTIPAMVVGLEFEKYVEANFRSPLISVATLVIFAVFLYVAERSGRQTRTLEHFSLSDSFWVGTSQALALIPGVSRSGITIGTSLLRDVDRTSAARFSFLLSTPIIVGAAILQGWHLVHAVRDPAGFAVKHAVSGPVDIHWGALAVGTIFASVTGFLCIRYFLRYIQSHSFVPFVVYRLFLAAAVLILYLRQPG